MNPKLLSVLACPLTKTRLIWDKEGNRLIATVSGLAFPIRDGVPILLEEEAQKLTVEEVTVFQGK